MLPDPNWKADQPGDQARTSGGKNNEDDDLGDDMPSWIFKEESNRKETKKTAMKREDSKKKPASPKNDSPC